MMAKPDDELLFVPLGGAEEIGMNFNLYGFGPPGEHQWLIIDLGITFGDDTTPSIDIILPDPQFIEERLSQLTGIVLTHGHEDHLGAVPYLWGRLRCPVYATPFTAALLRRKLEAEKQPALVEIIEIPLQGKFSVGPFELELITLTHSMPEPNAVVVRTPLGNIFHTGDWKFDPDPVIGPASDQVALKALGDEGVLAVIGDSTNVFVEGVSGSEADLLDRLSDVIGRVKGKVAVTCFASNVARLQTIFHAAAAQGRAVALVGRSLWRINAAARETGYLTDLPDFLEPEEMAAMEDGEILYICTGSQGEPRAALTRIAAGDHRSVSLGEGDAAIFSSRIIPGNELAIGRLHNALVRRGVDVISELDENIHVSGHPAQAELTEMYQLVRPQILIPVHGEQRHLKKHAEIAAQCQVPETVLVENGSVVRIAPGKAAIIDQAPVGRLALDGGRLVPLDGQVVRERSRVLFNGSAVFTLIVDSEGWMAAAPQLTMLGLADDDEAPYVLEQLTEEAKRAIAEMSEADRRDDAEVGEMTRRAIRRHLRDTFQKRPLTTVHVVRV
ncbi:MAG: ribonuclease J [Rhodospirillales bacterium]